MTSKLSVKAALARASQLNNPDVLHQANEAASLLNTVCDISQSISVTVPDWTEDDARAACLSKKTLLERKTPLACLKDFIHAGEALTETYCSVVKPSADIEKMARAISWETLLTQEELDKGLANPQELIETVLNRCDERIEPLAALLVALSIRALLESSVKKACELIEKLQKDTVHFNRPTQCPVCGATPAIACVAGTAYHGNVKQLYCSCCGAHWPFERIRCAVCGDQAVSDLTYVHDANDESRRLHICKNCKAAFPTVFVGDAEQFDPEIDGIAIAGLADYYLEHEKEMISGKEINHS